MTKPISVLFITSVFPRWDGDSTPPFVQNLAESLASDQCHITVLAPGFHQSAFHEQVNRVEIYRFPYFFPPKLQKLCYEGGMLVNVHVRPWTKCLLPFFFIAQFLSLFALCIRLKPDLVHSHSLIPQGLTAAFVCKLLGIKHLTTSHGNDVFGLKKTGLMGRLKRFVLRNINAVTVNSQATMEAVRNLSCPTHKIHLIPASPNQYPIINHIVAQAEQSWAPHKKRILFVGRLIPSKGILELIETVHNLIIEIPNISCIVIGEGPLKTQCLESIKKYSLENNFQFLSWKPKAQISSWMSTSDILVVPSWGYEAQGLVITEAMFAKTPVIASNLGGIPDLVKDGFSGYLCEPGSVDSLTLVLRKFFNTAPTTINQITQEALSLVENNYSQNAVAQKTNRLYHNILDT